MKPHSTSFRSEKGSLLIVAMMLCAIIGISLASYLQLGRTGLTVSNRALYNNAAMNLAENGLEEAMYSINQMVEDPAYNWAGWTNDGTNAWKKFTGYNFDQNATGETRVYVYNYLGSAAPLAIARSTVKLGGVNSRPIEKWVEIQLRKTSKFANGLVAKDSIIFQGNNASVDSWNSDPDNNPGTAPVKYSAGVRNDNGSVGSISVSVDAVLVNNADIWGYAATGGAMPSVGSNGVIGPFGTASGTMNPGHVSTDFTASFDPVAMPTLTGSVGSITGTTTLGTAGGTATVTCTAISLSGPRQLNIQGDVTLLITAPEGTSAIDITGNAGINIAPGASLKIYTAGNIKIAGNGIANGGTTQASANQPVNLQVWGTSTSTIHDQDIDITGNGTFAGILYAPNGSVKIRGNGDVSGSVVAEDITLVGNAAFHYDESLANFGGGNPYRVARWKELTTAAERSAISSLLSF